MFFLEFMWNWLKKKTITEQGPLTSEKLARALAGAPSASGVNVTEDTAMRLATVFSCIRVRSEAFAQLPLIVCEVGEDGAAVPVRDHWLYKLFRTAPTPWNTTFEFLEKISIDLDTDGNYYAFMRKKAGQVTEFWPLPHGDVEASRSDINGEMAYKVNGLELNGSNVFGAEHIFHIRGLSRDGVVGLSPIRQSRDAIGLALAAERHGSRTFSHGARPSGVVKIPHEISDEDYERLARNWNENYGGDNVGKTAILEMGAEFTPISMSNEDVQFLDTRKFQRSEICGIYRVPPHMVGDLDNATFSNIEHQSLEFNMFAMAPLAKRVESAINRFVLPERERGKYYVKFNLDALVRGDLATRMSAYSTAIQNGIYNVDEVRALEDRPPRPGGQTYLQPLNMVAVGEDAETETETETAIDEAI